MFSVLNFVLINSCEINSLVVVREVVVVVVVVVL